MKAIAIQNFTANGLYCEKGKSLSQDEIEQIADCIEFLKVEGALKVDAGQPADEKVGQGEIDAGPEKAESLDDLPGQVTADGPNNLGLVDDSAKAKKKKK